MRISTVLIAGAVAYVFRRELGLTGAIDGVQRKAGEMTARLAIAAAKKPADPNAPGFDAEGAAEAVLRAPFVQGVLTEVARQSGPTTAAFVSQFLGVVG